MHLAATIDQAPKLVWQIPKPVWIGLVFLAFWHWWPLGLGLLAFLIWSGRMGCWGHRGYGRWHNHREGQGGGCGPWGGFRERRGSSGNRAFDEYRADTLRRLEEEEREFRDF